MVRRAGLSPCVIVVESCELMLGATRTLGSTPSAELAKVKADPNAVLNLDGGRDRHHSKVGSHAAPRNAPSPSSSNQPPALVSPPVQPPMPSFYALTLTATDN